MTVDELNPYLGTLCNLRLFCRGCGDTHLLTGTPRPGKHVGDFVLDGYTFSIEDIVQLWQQKGPPRRRVSRVRALLARVIAPQSSRARGASFP